LQRDLQQIQQQVTMNGEFLSEMESDPQLEERLALRQMHVVRQGERVLELKGDSDTPQPTEPASDAAQMSPFSIVHVPPPEPLPAYEPWGGEITGVFLNQRLALYLIGGGLLMVAMALVLGEPSNDENHRLTQNGGEGE
jgi:hypothetical protein